MLPGSYSVSGRLNTSRLIITYTVSVDPFYESATIRPEWPIPLLRIGRVIRQLDRPGLRVGHDTLIIGGHFIHTRS